MVWYVLSKVVSANVYPFHSRQATSHALQPMQVVVSTSLQTCSARSTPAPGTVPAWPEIFTIWSDAWFIPLCLFDLHKKALELRRECVWIYHSWAKSIGNGSRVPRFVFLNTAIALMNRYTDLEDSLAIDHHGLDAFRNECLRDVEASRARQLHRLAAFDAKFVSQLNRNLDEGFGNEFDIHWIILCPIVIVFGQPVRCADHVEAFTRRAELIERRLELLDDRIVRLLRMQRVLHRTFKRLVVLWEGSIGKSAQRPEDSSHPFGVHDEWPHVFLGI